MAKVTIKITKLSANAITPRKRPGTKTTFDLYSAYDYIIPAYSRVDVMTDILISFPNGLPGCYREYITLPNRNWLGVGTEMKRNRSYCVNISNLTNENIEIKKGDCIAEWSLLIYLDSWRGFITEEEERINRESADFARQIEQGQREARRKRTKKSK